MNLDMVTKGRPMNLERQETDIALRDARPVSSDLIAKLGMYGSCY